MFLGSGRLAMGAARHLCRTLSMHEERGGHHNVFFFVADFTVNVFLLAQLNLSSLHSIRYSSLTVSDLTITQGDSVAVLR
jgi:hypothetical protein